MISSTGRELQMCGLTKFILSYFESSLAAIIKRINACNIYVNADRRAAIVKLWRKRKAEIVKADY